MHAHYLNRERFGRNARNRILKNHVSIVLHDLPKITKSLNKIIMLQAKCFEMHKKEYEIHEKT